jgi:hypothetical protein
MAHEGEEHVFSVYWILASKRFFRETEKEMAHLAESPFDKGVAASGIAWWG